MASKVTMTSLFVCENIILDKQNRLSAINIFDNINIKSMDGKNIFPRFFVVFKCECQDNENYNIKSFIKNKNNDIIAKIEEVVINSKDKTTLGWISAYDFVGFNVAGEYVISVNVNDDNFNLTINVNHEK